MNLWSNGLVVNTLDSQSRGSVFETTVWLQGRFSLSFFRGRSGNLVVISKLPCRSGSVALRQLNPTHEKGS